MRRRLSYANVVATLALVFAMSGGALAANHYLINSTKQINPKILKKLRGTRGPSGPRGLPGANGTTGSAGSAGSAGSQGPKGNTGANGLSALSNLPSGQTESGDYGVGGVVTTIGQPIEAAVSFPVPLAERAPLSQVVYTNKWPVEHCSGPGSADKGFLCLYNGYTFQVNGALKPAIFNVEKEGSTSNGEPGTGRFGFYIQVIATGTEPGFGGSYTVTAG